MTKFTKVDLDITQYKPRMKPVYVSDVSDLEAIPFDAGKTTVQVKADGEFNLIHIDRKQIYAVNRFGRKTEDLPALRELHVLFLKHETEQAEILAEIYAVDESGKPVTLPNFIHYLKGGDKSLQSRIHLGMFDLIKNVDSIGTINPSKIMDSIARFKSLRNLNGKLCHVLEYIIPKDWEEVENYYEQKVNKEGWEGLVVRSNGDTWKAKPNRDVDAVIIGINKNNKGYAKGLAKSVRVALMRDDGSFVELGDATVASEAEARELFALTRVKVNENTQTVFVKPLVVVQIDFISLFPETTNRVYKLLLGGMMEIGTMQAVRMKSPRVKGYRKDKHACTEDVGLNQIE